MKRKPGEARQATLANLLSELKRRLEDLPSVKGRDENLEGRGERKEKCQTLKKRTVRRDS